ncbi:MAG: tryptophan--tRNA ligase [Phycisphaerales bacterium]|jgi:tryptophanyl-tRNA synthetase|nr:tryptophan--tRNA ligase [Phycisphaerales bacterium]
MSTPHATATTAGKPRILTGDTPTSTGLHLGHYVGSLENRLQLQQQYDCFFLIANVHAFTTLAEKPADIRANTMGIVKDWLAVGLDPDASTFVLQSEIPAIAELTFFFAMLLPFNKVMRNPTLKTEIDTKGLGDSYPFGFPMYAVGQCADILAFRPELVPVGEDQEAHIEMCRDVAGKFNQLYCGVNNRVPLDEHAKPGTAGASGLFPVPKAKIGRVARLAGLDGVNKMSKSLGNAIFLYDDDKAVQKKINKITVLPDEATKLVPQSHVLLQYCDAFLPAARAKEIRAMYAAGGEVMHGHIKAELGAAINTLLTPMRARRADMEARPDKGDGLVLDILRRGAARANTIAEETLYRAKQAMQIDIAPRRIGM